MFSDQKIRSWVQIIFFTLISLTALNHALTESGTSLPYISDASLHALCPFGAVVSIYELATTGSFVKKIHASAMVLLGVTFTLAVLFGPVFCGWICPLGTLQEWIGNIRNKVPFFKRFTMPDQLDRSLKYLRYVVLAYVVYATAVSGIIIFEDFDPYYALFNFWSGEVAITATLILVVTLIGSLFVERAWCRYACPFGGLLGLFNKFRITRIVRQDSTCIHCSRCDNACPMGISVSNSQVVKSTSCITCLKCTSGNQCPIEDTVSFKLGGDAS